MRGTANRQAFEKYLEGERLYTVLDSRRMARARKCFEEAVEMDDRFARAWGWLSYSRVRSVLAGFLPERWLETAESDARRAVELDPHDYAPHWDLAFAYLNRQKFDEAIAEYEVARDLYDNLTDRLDRKPGLLAEMAEAYVSVGQAKRGLELARKAMLVPHWYGWNLGWAYYANRQYDKAIEVLEGLPSSPKDPHYHPDVQLFLAAAWAQQAEKLERRRTRERGKKKKKAKTRKKRGAAEPSTETQLRTARSRGRSAINAFVRHRKLRRKSEKEILDHARRRGNFFKDPRHQQHWLDGIGKACRL